MITWAMRRGCGSRAPLTWRRQTEERDIVTAFIYLLADYKENKARFFPEVHSERMMKDKTIKIQQCPEQPAETLRLPPSAGSGTR